MLTVRDVASCFECAMLHVCHRVETLERNAARRQASLCEHPAKGKTTDVIRVVGRDRGMSRKNAVRMACLGKVVWLDRFTIALVAPQSSPQALMAKRFTG